MGGEGRSGGEAKWAEVPAAVPRAEVRAKVELNGKEDQR
jgi:hypothetical protein